LKDFCNENNYLTIFGSKEFIFIVTILTLWLPGGFKDFHKKTPKFTCLCTGISPLLFGLRTWSKCQKNAASLLVCTQNKKIFCLGGGFFCEWRHKWRTFRPPWPILPGPSYQMFHNCWLKPKLELHRFWHLCRDLCDMSWTVCWSN